MICCLISSSASPCIDPISIPADTNEMAIYQRCVADLVETYGKLDLFRMVATDAGTCSQENASFTRSHGLHYFFALENTQPTLHGEAVRLLGALEDYEAVARSEDHLGGERVARRNLHITRHMDGYCREHLRTVLRVQSQIWDHGVLVKSEDRSFVCSLAADRLSNAHWLRLLRRYWMVENGPHYTLDVALHEDDHPLIEADPQGALVLALVRRVAYNLLALFRNVTLRGESSRMMPWKQLIGELHHALLKACDSDLTRRRDHIPDLAESRSPRRSDRARASAVTRRGQKLATWRAVDRPRSNRRPGPRRQPNPRSEGGDVGPGRSAGHREGSRPGGLGRSGMRRGQSSEPGGWAALLDAGGRLASSLQYAFEYRNGRAR